MFSLVGAPYSQKLVGHQQRRKFVCYAIDAICLCKKNQTFSGGIHLAEFLIKFDTSFNFIIFLVQSKRLHWNKPFFFETLSFHKEYYVFSNQAYKV